MKKCPFCAEIVQSEAMKCRYCGELLNEKSSIRDEHEQLTIESKKGGLTKSASEPLTPSPQQGTESSAPREKLKEKDEKRENYGEKLLLSKQDVGHKPLLTLPNVLFILYLLIVVPISFHKPKSFSVYYIGRFLGISLVPIIFVVLCNLKKNSKLLILVSSIVSIIWILLIVFGTLGGMEPKREASNPLPQDNFVTKEPVAPAPAPQSFKSTTTQAIKTDGPFIAYSNGTVVDTRTNLMWAARDNGSDINWRDAKSYCENYRGGGYTDWRMPTQDELAGLYDESKTYKSESAFRFDVHLTELIRLTSEYMWASSTRQYDSWSEAATFNFALNERYWHIQVTPVFFRALPVRSIN